MAQSASIVFEVRSATGSDNNSGGFKTGASGTDWSQQAAAQYALSGVTSAGAGNTILTASAANDMVGNMLQVISGTNFTTGFFEITSVSAGVSITCATNNSGASICTGVGAAGVINIGGALAKVSTAIAQMLPAGGNITYFKGSETITADITLPAFTGPALSIIQGYGTTRGDTTQATITTSTNSVNGILQPNATVADVVLRNLEIKSTAGTPGNGIQCGTAVGFFQNLLIDNCRIHGWNRGMYGPYSGQLCFIQLLMINCEVDHCTDVGVVNSGGTWMLGCKIHDNTNQGVSITQNFGNYTDTVCIGTAFYSNGSHGIQIESANSSSGNSRRVQLNGCAFWTNTGDGVFSSSAVDLCLAILNCVFELNSHAVNLAQAPGSNINQNNAYRANTTANVNWPAGTNDVTLTAECFNSPSTGDYTRNSTAGGGAALAAAGFQSSILG